MAFPKIAIMWMLGRHYVDTMLKVPVLHPKDLTYMEMSVLGESFKTMCGLSEHIVIDDPDVAESAALVADSAALVADSAATLHPLQEYVKTWHLYRSTVEESVVWFPHDNHPDLLKELIWESGSPVGCCMAWVFRDRGQRHCSV